MKTQSEHVQRWDDIIFENRNKDYGAYAIRKNYKDNVLKAEAISIGIGALLFIIPILLPDKKIDLPIQPETDKGLVLRHVDPIEPVITHRTAPPVRTNASIIPTRVTSQEVPDEPQVQSPSDDVTYTTGPDPGSTSTTGTEASTGTGNVEIPVDVPPAPPFMLAPEVMPAYDGGMEAMMKFIQKKMRYPRRAQENREEGIVYVSFIINARGEVTSVEVIKGFHADCDKEATRVISLMEKWKPGLQNKMPVAVKMVLPIKFKLQG